VTMGLRKIPNMHSSCEINLSLAKAV